MDKKYFDHDMRNWTYEKLEDALRFSAIAVEKINILVEDDPEKYTVQTDLYHVVLNLLRVIAVVAKPGIEIEQSAVRNMSENIVKRGVKACEEVLEYMNNDMVDAGEKQDDKNNMSESALAERRKYQNQWAKDNRERRNEALKRWRKENPEKVKAANRRYWEKRANKISEE